jgi:hypothetical protein
MTAETWKPIPGFPGYDVSDQGRVRSYRRVHGFGEWIVANEPQRILRPGTDPNGYKFVQLMNGDRRVIRVQALVMLAFVGPCPEGFEICHNDGTRANNSLANLRYDTHTANMRETKASALAAKRRAERQEKIEARRARSQANLARRLGWSRQRLHYIVKRAGLNGVRPIDWKYIAKHGLREYAEKVMNVQVQEASR